MTCTTVEGVSKPSHLALPKCLHVRNGVPKCGLEMWKNAVVPF